jgi:ribosome-binding factor A
VSERTARLDELLRQEISSIIGRAVHDPQVGFVTVTRVDVAPDLRNATVWVSTIGQPPERRETLRALTRAMPFVRRELRVLHLRRIPELHVKLDDTAERGTRVLQILRDLEEGRDPAAAAPSETLPTPAPLGSAPEGAGADGSSAAPEASGSGEPAPGGRRPTGRSESEPSGGRSLAPGTGASRSGGGRSGGGRSRGGRSGGGRPREGRRG